MLYGACNSVAYLYSDDILISSSLVFKSGESCLPLDMDKDYSMKRNISHMLKTPNHPRFRYHQCDNFDLQDSVLARPKQWPDSYRKEYVGNANESELQWIFCDIVIIKDK